MILWFTGQPGSGKTTLAHSVGHGWLVDGDDLRLLHNPGYDEAGRRQNIDRAQAIAGFLHGKHWLVTVALVSPYRDQREDFKTRFPVLEVFLHTDEIRGKEDYFVNEYQPPLTDFISIDTGKVNIEEAKSLIHRTLATTPSRA